MQTNITVLPFCSIISAVSTAIILKFLIPILKSKKMGQKILDIGPRWHKDKEGTPTMGGIAFIFTTVVISLVFWAIFFRGSELSVSFLLSLGYCTACGLIGVSDDLCKLKKSQNEGLTATQKYLLQLITASLYLILMKRSECISETIFVPIFNRYIDLGFWYYPLFLLILSGFNNAVNLTDGLDGLCASVTSVVSLGFLALALYADNSLSALLCAAVFGALLGFLFYNFHPAKVFMGDTGSLFLGGAVSAMALMSENPLILFAFGAVYVLEAASVIIQVMYFKLTGKRFFKMAPFHHHLEKCGWGEVKITLVSSAITFIISVVCVFMTVIM